MGNAVNPILLRPLSLSLVIIELCVENRCEALHSFIKALPQGVGAEGERLLQVCQVFLFGAVLIIIVSIGAVDLLHLQLKPLKVLVVGFRASGRALREVNEFTWAV